MRRFTFVLLLAVQCFSFQALATKARLQALSQDSDGSLLIEDERNVFLNPAYINRVPNMVNFEWGESQLDATAPPKAEGGVFYKGEQFNYGLQLGRTADATESMLGSGSLADGGSFFLPQNSFDFILGKAVGTPWGVGLHYASSSSDRKDGAGLPDSEARVVSVRGGVWESTYSVYGLFDLIHNSETDLAGGGTESYDGKLSLGAGGHMDLDQESKLTFQILQRGFDFDNGAGASGDAQTQSLAVNYMRKLNPMAADLLLFYAAGLAWQTSEYDFEAAGVTTQEETYTYVPVVIGVEAPAKSWLTLRASVQQNLIIDRSESVTATTETVSEGLDMASVGAGASVMFDDFRLDATFSGATTGELDGDSLFSNVSLLYNF